MKINNSIFAILFFGIFSVNGYGTSKEIAFPSSEVLEINRATVLLRGYLKQARTTVSVISTGCFYLGQSSVGQQNLMNSASKIHTLLQGAVFGGLVPPEWLIQLEKLSEMTISFSSPLKELSQPCLSSGELGHELNPVEVGALLTKVDTFLSSLQPYVKRAIEELPLPPEAQ